MKKSKQKPLPEGVIISEPFKKKRVFGKLFKKLNSPVLITVLLIVAAAMVAFMLLQSEEKIAPPKQVDLNGLTEYGLMTKDQANYYLYTKTGLTVEYLQSRNLNGKNLKSFDTARHAAQALMVFDDKTKALQAYSVAQDKKPNDNDHLFYLEYADAALRNKDKVTWKKEMLLAREILVKKPQAPASGDDVTELQLLESRMKLVEAYE